jgi:PAS domain S-box-containing protein
MDIDIRTVVLIAGVFKFVMLLVFLYQFRAAKSVSGPGWWLLWTLGAILSSSVILVRHLPGMLPVAIMIQNPLIATGPMFIYIGLLVFFEKKPGLRQFVTGYLIYYFLHLFFYLVIDDSVIRTLILFMFTSIFTFLSAFCIFRNRNKSISLTANANAIVLTVHGLIQFVRVVIIFAGIHSPSMFETSFLNYLFYFDDLVIGILLAFGLIIMINQKLNSEIGEAKNHFEKIFNTTPDSVIICRLSDGRFVDCNDSFLKLTGFDREERPGMNLIIDKMLANPDDARILGEIIIKEGFCENREIEYKQASGITGSCLVNAGTITLKGVPHIICLIHDITLRKNDEDCIKLINEKLKRTNAEKDKLFSILAHDLISPFNSFLGLTEIMLNEDPDVTAEDMRKHASMIHDVAHNLFRLLTNLLDWSRLERGLIPFNPEKMKLYPLMSESLEPIYGQAEAKNIELSFNIAMNIEINSDRNAFKTIIRNLVSNAIKFTPSGGRIIISARPAENSFVEISVKDTGIGMNQELLENIFSIDAKTSRRGTDGELSTGLGLILCKDFIEKSTGEIWAKSEERKGSEFFFTIPAGN